MKTMLLNLSESKTVAVVTFEPMVAEGWVKVECWASETGKPVTYAETPMTTEGAKMCARGLGMCGAVEI